MRIKLENLANISSIDYEIENSKINFLFGISGSGKSSIANSLINPNMADVVTAGRPASECKIELLNSPATFLEDVAIFNYKYLEDVLIIKNKSEEMYKVLFSGENRIELFKAAYQSTIGKLFLSKDRIRKIVEQIRTLEKSISLKFTQKGEYIASCAINKFQKTVLSKNDGTLAKKYSGKRAQWFLDGKNSDEYSDGKCPFCGRRLSDYRISIVESIINLDFKSYDKIRDAILRLDELKLIEPKWEKTNSTNSFKKKLIDLIEIKCELEIILTAIDATSVSEYNPDNIKKVKLSKKTKEFFPELVDEVNGFNDEYKNLKIAFNKLRSETNKVLRANIKDLNKYLKRFAIPYSFESAIIDGNNKTAGYYLKHNDDIAERQDRTNWLSFGEKNIIGLLLFIVINANKKMIVIDDPASSFDNYRRKIILDLIFEKKGSNSTYLVLSHDEVFIKIATYFAEKNRKKLLKNADLSTIERKYAREMGKATFIECNNQHALVEIDESDFGNYENFVKLRLKSLDRTINHQTSILLRMLLEGKRKDTVSNKNAYRYLSAIIHETDYGEICALMNENGIIEADVLRTIETLVGEAYSPLSETYLSDIKKFSYSDFEIMFLYREKLKNLKGENEKAVLSEINNIVHQTSTYISCLNPFKYNMFGPLTSKYIGNFKTRFNQRFKTE